MTEKPTEQQKTEQNIGETRPEGATQNETAPNETGMPKEIGGRKGPEPTRYGDWEKGGLCSDF